MSRINTPEAITRRAAKQTARAGQSENPSNPWVRLLVRYVSKPGGEPNLTRLEKLTNRVKRLLVH